MSRTSDSELDFESADEGGDNVDIDLSDLSISDDEDNKTLNQHKQQMQQQQTIQKEIKQNCKNKEEIKTNSAPTILTDKNKKENENLDISRSLIKQQTNTETVDNQINKLVVKGDEEIDQLLKSQSNLIKESASQIYNREELNSKSELSKKIETLYSGWEDTELNDNDIDEDIDETTSAKTGDCDKSTCTSATKFAGPKLDIYLTEYENDKQIPTEESKIEGYTSKSDKQSKSNSSTGVGWSWTNLGTSFVSSAVALLETVEGAIGAPDPTELAAKIVKEKKDTKFSDDVSDNTSQSKDLPSSQPSTNKKNENLAKDSATSTFDDWSNGDWFSLPSKQLSKLASTGNQFVAGSLDVLETIGKTTIEVLNNKDPDLKQTRELIKLAPANSSTNLSQLLREAQLKNQQKEQSLARSSTTAKPLEKQEQLTFGMYFEEFKGFAHLEAFDMLSKQINLKCESVLFNKKTSSLNLDQQDQLKELNELFSDTRLENEINENEEDEEEKKEKITKFNSNSNKSELIASENYQTLINHDTKSFDFDRFESILHSYSLKLNLKSCTEKLNQTFKLISLAFNEIDDPIQLFSESIKCFALLTSRLIEFYHKSCELMLVDEQILRANANRMMQLNKKNRIIHNAQSLYQLTRLFMKSLTILSNDFSKKCALLYKESA